MLLSHCAVSRVIKGLNALLYDTSTGVTLASWGNSSSEKIQGLVVLSLQDSPHCSTSKVSGYVITKILPNAQIPTDAPTRTKFQWFTSKPLLSSFKKLIVLAPRLQCYLHTMSLAKAVPEGIKDRECKKDHLTQTSSGFLYPQERLCSRDGACPQE